MDLLASYDSSSESEPDLAQVPLIPPRPDMICSGNNSSSSNQLSGTSSAFDSRSTVFSSSTTASSVSALSGQGFDSSSCTSLTDDSPFPQPVPRFATQVPPPQVDCAAAAKITTAASPPNPVTAMPGLEGSPGPDLTPAEQRAQLLRLAAAATAPSPQPEIPPLPAAPDGGLLVAQFLALKSPLSSLSPAPPVHFNVKFAANMQLHDPKFIERQAAFMGVGITADGEDGNGDSDGYISKFVQRGDRDATWAAMRRQRAAPRTRVEFTSAAGGP